MYRAVATFVALIFVAGFTAASTLPVYYDAPLLPARDTAFRMTFHGNFTEGARFVIVTNSSSCSEGTELAVGSTPPGVISNVVEWNKHDPSAFLVAQFVATLAVRDARACYSPNGGRQWARVPNRRNRFHFHIWNVVPTITRIVPSTVSVGHPVYVSIDVGIPHKSVGALTTLQDGCDGEKPVHALPGANETVWTAATKSFMFQPLAAAEAVYLCVATDPLVGDWSLIPYDPNGIVADRGNQDGLASGRLPPNGGRIVVHSTQARHVRAEISCGIFVEGETSVCTVTIANKTDLVVSPSDVTFSRLKDGGGVNECPHPVFFQPGDSASTLKFRYTPSRFGRGGEIGLLYLGVPVFHSATAWSEAWYDFSNSTRAPLARHEVDDGFLRFIVHPGFRHIPSYQRESLLTFSHFSPSTNWQFSRDPIASPGFSNGTNNVFWGALEPTATTGTMTQTINIPSGTTTALLQARYFYSAAKGVFQERSMLIGQVEVQRGASTYATYQLYSTGAGVTLVKDNVRTRAHGDARAWESIVAEVPTDSSVTSITVTITAYQDLFIRTLYFADVELRYSRSVHTRGEERTALERIYAAVASPLTALPSWSPDGATFDDPCVNHWQGVTCRNMHVVALDLTGVAFTDGFPSIAELTWLERLVLRRNSLRGTVPVTFANFSRLEYVDLTDNHFTEIPGNVFSPAHSYCLRYLSIRHNELRHFPKQVLQLPRLQELNLGFNDMTGGLGNWEPTAPLVHLDLSHNLLYGALPTLPVEHLISVDFGVNKFNGTIPVQWGELRRVQLLDVSKNELSGRIPHELSRVASGQFLTFRGEENFFNGLLPNLGFRLVDVRDNIFHCPLPKAERFVLTSQYGGMDAMECDYGPGPDEHDIQL